MVNKFEIDIVLSHTCLSWFSTLVFSVCAGSKTKQEKKATTQTQTYNLWACRPIQQLMPVRRFGRVSRQLYELEMLFVCVRSLSCETMITIMRQCICYDDTVTIARMPDGEYWFHWNREFSVISDQIRWCAVCFMFFPSLTHSLSISLCLTRSICGHFSFQRSFIWFGTINMNDTSYIQDIQHTTKYCDDFVTMFQKKNNQQHACSVQFCH